MCRLAGYLGEPITLSQLTDLAPHGLYRQSYAAKELTSAVVCADGWGAAWYLERDAQPCLYRSTSPIWADVNRSHLGRAIRSHALLAAVRSATDPESVAHANTQPFAGEALSFVHNGYVDQFASRVLGPLRAALSPRRQAQLNGNTDSEHLAALLFDEYAELSTTAPAQRLAVALGRAVSRFERLVSDAGSSALIAVAVSDGSWLAGVRCAVGGSPPSLYYSASDSGALLSSEPLDDRPGWTAVPPRRVVMAGRGGGFEERAL